MGMRIGRLAAIAALTGVVGFGAIGCGGGGGDDDAKEIKAVVLKARQSDDPQVACVDTVTENFVNTIYRGVAACKQAEAASKDDAADKPKDVKLTGLKVDGDKASGTVELIGGNNNGSKGEIGFAKDGGNWKVDSLSVGFLRSSLDTSLAAAKSSSGDNPLSNPDVASCAKQKFAAMPDAKFTQLAYDAIAQRDENKDFVEVITTCLSSAKVDDGSGTKISTLRKQFEDNVRSSAANGKATAAQLECVIKRLRTTLSDDDILKSANDSGAKSKVSKAAQTAFLECVKG